MNRRDLGDAAALGELRYEIKRASGIGDTRRDGSRCSLETDRESAAAEAYAANTCGEVFNTTVTEHGDGGVDFELRCGVEVVWLGMNGEVPRMTGNLIVNPDEPQRWAAIYVVVRGSIATGFALLGWTTHAELKRQPQRDFGFGKKFAMPTWRLYPMTDLAL